VTRLTGERVSAPVGGFNPTYQRHVAAYARCAELLPPGAVLDVGAGTQHSAELLAPRESIAVDIDPEALAGLERPTVVADMRALPFVDETFASAVAVHSIEHVPDPAALLGECHRLLAPGGVLALSTPDAGSLLARVLRGRWLGFRSIDEHLYFFSRRTLARMLERAGFEVRRFLPAGKYLTLPRLIERMRFYTRVGALLLRTADRMVPRLSLYVDPRDTMYVLAVKSAPRSPAGTRP